MKIILSFLSLSLSLGSCIFAMENPKAIERPIYEVLAERDARTLIEKVKKPPHFKPLRPEAIDFDKKYQKFVNDYKEKESHLDELNKSFLLNAFGGINYSMTLDEMKLAVKEKFQEMKNNGIIISKDDFEKIKDKYFWKPRDNLTRIWGANYLKHKFNESEYLNNKYDVPKYVIVLDDPHNLKVKLLFENKIFAKVNLLLNGSIYFEKIEGLGSAYWGSPIVQEIGEDSGIGYDDFSDPNNIIVDDLSGKFYVIDTEFKSFKFNLDPELEYLAEYAFGRFRYLNDNIKTYIYDMHLE